mmetsp:Transcript_32995/g.50521  ORF Transcript_32995/g.50521 Transcript_32995/m.50521 type:complete len:89 (+) Transcript_32995:809-1075(+)
MSSRKASALTTASRAGKRQGSPARKPVTGPSEMPTVMSDVISMQVTSLISATANDIVNKHMKMLEAEVDFETKFSKGACMEAIDKTLQ